MIDFTSSYFLLKQSYFLFKLQQFNMISFFPSFSFYLDYLKYRYKSNECSKIRLILPKWTLLISGQLFLKQQWPLIGDITVSTIIDQQEKKKEFSQRFTWPRNRWQKSQPHVSCTSQCWLCSKDDKLAECNQFETLSVDERLRLVKVNKLCFNCLSNSHIINSYSCCYIQLTIITTLLLMMQPSNHRNHQNHRTNQHTAIVLNHQTSALPQQSKANT